MIHNEIVVCKLHLRALDTNTSLFVVSRTELCSNLCAHLFWLHAQKLPLCTHAMHSHCTYFLMPGGIRNSGSFWISLDCPGCMSDMANVRHGTVDGERGKAVCQTWLMSDMVQWMDTRRGGARNNAPRARISSSWQKGIISCWTMRSKLWVVLPCTHLLPDGIVLRQLASLPKIGLRKVRMLKRRPAETWQSCEKYRDGLAVLRLQAVVA